MRATLSTNGTLITPEVARLRKYASIRYRGVSLDSADSKTNDKFGGVNGTWEMAIVGKNAKKQV
ncbi:MAG: hypothetical protein QXL78_03990 [Methanocellales archaeon]